MITHRNFLWFHLPRTGGTTTAAWLRAVNEALLLGALIDPDEQPKKHDNRLIRELRGTPGLSRRSVAMNMRSLPEWLFSNYKFARRKGLAVPLDRYLKGEYFSLRVGAWCPADWWLHYFGVEDITHFLWVDRLEADWRCFIQETLELTVPECIHMDVRNAIASPREDSRDLSDYDWSVAFARNALWRNLEQGRYD